MQQKGSDIQTKVNRENSPFKRNLFKFSVLYIINHLPLCAATIEAKHDRCQSDSETKTGAENEYIKTLTIWQGLRSTWTVIIQHINACRVHAELEKEVTVVKYLTQW